MWWKSNYEEINGTAVYTYSYFTFSDTNLKNLPAPYYNSWTREITYPVKKELVIATKEVSSEDEFILWYHLHIIL